MAARIRELRQTAGISQASAARHAGVSKWSWQRYETADRAPTIHRLDAIARALDCPIAAIYDPTVVAEVRLSDAARARLAVDPQALAADLAARLLPTLLATTTAPNHPTPTLRPGQPLSPVGVAERLLRSKREGLRIAEWQLREAQRAESVE